MSYSSKVDLHIYLIVPATYSHFNNHNALHIIIYIPNQCTKPVSTIFLKNMQLHKRGDLASVMTQKMIKISPLINLPLRKVLVCHLLSTPHSWPHLAWDYFKILTAVMNCLKMRNCPLDAWTFMKGDSVIEERNAIGCTIQCVKIRLGPVF